MDRPFSDPNEHRDRDRCPRCGCLDTATADRVGSASVRTCRICGHRLPVARPSPDRATAVLPDPLDEESAWQTWQHAIHVERWIWFVFVVGLLVAGVVGLVRVG